MNSDVPTPLVLVRHGESTWNVLRLVQGQNDESRLTPRGRQQIADVVDELLPRKFDLIVSSDLRRTTETAAVLAERLGLAVETESMLRERSFGVAEGSSLDDLSPDSIGIRDGVVTDEAVSPPGGETLRAFRDRATRFLELRERRWAGVRLLVVTHGGTMRALRSCRDETQFQGSPWDRIDNCAVMTLTPPTNGMLTVG